MEQLLYKVLLNKQGVGVVGFETTAVTDTEAVSKVMDEAFKMFPDSKFGLHSIEKSDGDTTIIRTKYLGAVAP